MPAAHNKKAPAEASRKVLWSPVRAPPPPPVGFAWVLGLAGFVLVAVAIVDTSRSP